MKNIKFDLTYCILAVAGAILIAMANHSMLQSFIENHEYYV